VLSSCDAACKKEVEEKALAGDVQAARDAVTINIHAGTDEIQYWTQVGAENGDIVAQRNLALQLLLESASERDQLRGVFWLERAASGGSEQAAKELARYRRGGRNVINPSP
jgi:TPR repeat protein